MKRPRQYAFEIIKMETELEREAALSKVPDKFRDWVRDLVDSHFEMKEFK